MSSYLCEMNPQVWWMVDAGLSHALEDCPQPEAQKNCLYLETHASNALSSALSAEIKDEIEMEYVCLKDQTFFGKCLIKCLAQSMTRYHHQIFQRISHHHLYTLIKIKKSNLVFTRKRLSLPV
jgi:hypothetical protein